VRRIGDLDSLEKLARAVGGVAGLATLAVAVVSMLQSLRRPAALEEGGAHLVLRPWLMALATAAFVGVGVVVWDLLPIDVPPSLRGLLLTVGSLLLFGGLGLYLAGLRSLGTSHRRGT
jgi:hypothetical protein